MPDDFGFPIESRLSGDDHGLCLRNIYISHLVRLPRIFFYIISFIKCLERPLDLSLNYC